ncbi:hypothetical protein CBS101457_003271 [Exobasidium rhododendri]|nr:hypothetical protein CBS101457_003271 [Exobasidium rhododendri]
MSGNTTDAATFKKTTQTVGGGDNNKLVGNTNDQLFKEHNGSDGNINDPPRSADSAIERDLETKGYTTRSTDAELDEVQDMSDKLSKRGNEAQKGARGRGP